MTVKRRYDQHLRDEHFTDRHDKTVYDNEGVDLTLIRWMLSLTPSERLEVLQKSVRSLIRLRNDAGT